MDTSVALFWYMGYIGTLVWDIWDLLGSFVGYMGHIGTIYLVYVTYWYYLLGIWYTLRPYHSACQVYKVSRSKLPDYHYQRLFKDDGTEKKVDFKLSLGKSNFFYQSNQIWRNLPLETRNSKNISLFKQSCKKWIRNNVSIRP